MGVAGWNALFCRKFCGKRAGESLTFSLAVYSNSGLYESLTYVVHGGPYIATAKPSGHEYELSKSNPRFRALQDGHFLKF